MTDSPTYPPPPAPALSSVLDRNIQALCERRMRDEQAASPQEKLAHRVTRFTGSMLFVYLHLLFYGMWVMINLGWLPGIPTWDESFVILAMEASVEAIFLSTFVLITQNRMAAQAATQADLDLQISLLAEHEITKLTTLVSEIADRLRISSQVAQEVEEAKKDVSPERVLDRLEREA